MKKHNGMRPQDIVVLLKIASYRHEQWFMKDLAYALGISQSEISESLHRSMIAGLLASDKRRLIKASLKEFISFGLKYVYPQKPGAVVRGMATAISAPPLNDQFENNEHFVWPWANGKSRGQSIEPLHKAVPEACVKDPNLYEMLALVDTIRVGKVREQQMAILALNKRI